MCARGLIGSGRWKHRAPHSLSLSRAVERSCSVCGAAPFYVWSLLLLANATDSAETSFLIPSDYARSAHRGATLALKWTTKINTVAGKSALGCRDDSLILHHLTLKSTLLLKKLKIISRLQRRNFEKNWQKVRLGSDYLICKLIGI